MDNTARIIETYNTHKDTRITSNLLELPESDVRYVLRLNNIPIHNRHKDQTCDHKYYKYNRQHMHRTTMSAQLGRALTSNEFVHHIDFNKSNNNISNLIIVTPEEHMEIEKQIRFVLEVLINKGIVAFNKETKSYLLSTKGQTLFP